MADAPFDQRTATSDQIADFIESAGYDLRINTWKARGLSEWTIEVILRWLDEIGASYVERGNRAGWRRLNEPHSDAIALIRRTPYRFVRKEREVDAGRPFVVIDPGPRPVFFEGAAFSSRDMRECDGHDAFPDGTRFMGPDGSTGFWYQRRLWRDGDEPRLWWAGAQKARPS